MKKNTETDSDLDDSNAEHSTLVLTLTSLIYNNEECKVITFRDVTEVKKLAKI